MTSTEVKKNIHSLLEKHLDGEFEISHILEGEDAQKTYLVILADDRLVLVKWSQGELTIARQCAVQELTEPQVHPGLVGGECRALMAGEAIQLRKMSEESLEIFKRVFISDEDGDASDQLLSTGEFEILGDSEELLSAAKGTPGADRIAAPPPLPPGGAELALRPTKSIPELHQAIKMNPDAVQNYRDLFTLYFESGKIDAAWCVAATLRLLQLAAPRERDFYAKFAGLEIPHSHMQISDSQWDALRHRELDTSLGSVFGVFAALYRDQLSDQLTEKWRIDKKRDLLDLSESTQFTKLFNYAVRTLGVTPCRAYTKDSLDGWLRNANADPPAILVRNDILAGKSDRSLAFVLGKNLTLMRSEHYMGSAIPEINRLVLYVYASLAATRPELELPVGNKPEFERILGMINAKPNALASIQKSMNKVLDSGENPDVERWLRGLEHTSDRAGLLLSGDVNAAVEMIKEEDFTLSTVSLRDRILDILLFGVSQEYLALREELRLFIED